MGNNNLKGTNDILVKADQNNLIYIDPNSVLSNGIAQPRDVQPENLVMYVNLEADLIPRSNLIMNDKQTNLVSIARGTLNFLQNKDGKDYDTKWTDAYTDVKANSFDLLSTPIGVIPIPNSFRQTDETAQSFGIDNISIQVAGANFIPRVNIRFIDVRGKTLFESPENSPYSAFFHLPWPVFYLTVKGYYGKAIKYRLHLIKFNTKYNSNNGNFEIDCNFVGSTYAYLADISLEAVLNAPYFYASENIINTETNTGTGEIKQTISKTTKGYRVLKSVYQEYINKGLLPKGFPVRTLREIIVLAGSLDKTLSLKIFSEVIGHKTLAGVKQFEDDLTKFEQEILAWKLRRLSPEYFTNGTKRTNVFTGNIDDIRWFKTTGENKNTLIWIVGKDKPATLEGIINQYIEKFEKNETFGANRNIKTSKTEKIKTNSISLSLLKDIKNFYVQSAAVGVDIDGILDSISVIQKDFVEQRNKLETDIEQQMNDMVKDETKGGFGFEPTVRNIIGVILANAETYVRLMKDVHQKAFDNSQARKKILQSVLTDSIKTSDAIYPWPEIKLQTAGGKELVLAYPGSREMANKLQSDDSTLWPEVDFVENFFNIASKKDDNNVNKENIPENINYVFDSKIDTLRKDIGVLTNLLNYIPYTDKSISSILYEIYERAKYTTSLNPFNNDTIIELAKIEFANLNTQITNDIDVIDMLKTNITTPSALLSHMQASSLFDRFPYYEDQLPTISYIRDTLDQDFSVQKYIKNTTNTENYNSEYSKLTNFLSNYKPEDYRASIYPFNSSTYLSYLGQTRMDRKNLYLNGLLQVNTPDDFISSPIDPSMWVKDEFISNLFENTIKINGIDKHILNTPYFHQELYSGFSRTQSQEKYTAAAYLLLNSLPFKDLDDTTDNDTLVSTLFREIGASHYVPYHLMLKWGSIYHRYKKYIQTLDDIGGPVDIIGGIRNIIDGNMFFDYNSLGRTYNGVSRSTTNNIGFHPYYQTVFHYIVNGYHLFNPTIGPTSYESTITSGITYVNSLSGHGATIWTSYVDNSKFDSTDKRYTILPSNGYNTVDGSNFVLSEQENFRTIWGIGTDYAEDISYSGYTFPTPYEYFKLTGTTDQYSLETNYRKVIDLIATFKSDILDVFEQAFLDFASEKLNEEISYKLYDVKYNKFQDLLKAIVSVEQTNNVPTFDELKQKQVTYLEYLTKELISNENLIKITLSNPREIDNYVLGGFTGVNVKNFSVNSYYSANPDDIKLYLGEDLNGFYHDFFVVNDIDESTENINQFRSLVYMYAGLRANNITKTKLEFIDYLKDNIISSVKNNITGVSGQDLRLSNFLNQLVYEIQQNLKIKNAEQYTKRKRGYRDDPLKLELYNYFKSFNDKWISGNSIGQKTLMEEFLFLDKANRDIGNSVYLNMERLLVLGDSKNAKINLFSTISLLIQDSGFDIRALPAYVNFYGTNYSSTKKITPSKNVAQNMFGTFLDIDYQESSPKIILQYIGPTSKHLEISDINNKYKYKNDGFNIGDVNNNPIIVAPDVFTKTDFSQSNKVVAFEVSFGDQNQSIFKGVELDQSSIKNTSESFQVIENLGRSESGGNVSQVDIGLFNIYRQSSYQCQVTAMGNVMIQPTMYFYLKNIPMWKGSYWITEVTHNIKTTGIETIFKGTRIPAQSLPNPSDSFLASYRTFFDRLMKKANIKVKEDQERSLTGTTGTEKTIVTPAGASTYDAGTTKISGSGIINGYGHIYGIPYNGQNDEKYIQLIRYNNEEWLQAYAVQINGPTYKVPNDRSMSLLSRQSLGKHVIYGDIFNPASYYFTKFDLNNMDASTILDRYSKTEFLNPNIKDKKIRVTVDTYVDYNNNVYTGPVSIGPDLVGYGITLSSELMRLLNLYDGQLVYFKLVV